MSVMLRGSLPNDDRDGLQIAARKLAIKKQRGEPVVLVIECYLNRVTEKLHDKADPTDYQLAVGHVEMLTDDGDESFARSLLMQRYESRTGKGQLPFGTLLDEAGPDDEGETS